MSTSTELIAAYLRGDHAAVAEVNGWLARAANPFRRRLGADWEDVLQEIRVEVFRLLQHGCFRGESNLHTYLWQVAAHNCIDALRRQRRPPVIAEDCLEVPLLDGDPSPLDRMLQEESHQHRLAVLEAMPEECRELWGLILGGLGYRQIGRRLGVSEGTLRVRAHRCRKRALELSGSNAVTQGAPNE